MPGFVNAHSHAFQRALRGRAAGRDFWAWRDGMLEEADRHAVASIRALYADTYREMLAAGYTAVGEFHYLGIDAAFAAADAADEAGIGFVCLHVAYERGGLERMRQPTVAAYLEEVERLRAAGIPVGVAPHSVRACSRAWLEEIGSYAAAEGLVLHVHADEQPREIEECLAEHGVRPIELLARTGCLTAADDRRPRDACGRRRARPPAGRRGERLRVPDDGGRSRRRLLPRRSGAPPGDPRLHRVRLQRAHRSVRGAARARGHRAAPERRARRPHHGRALRGRRASWAVGRSASTRGRRSRSTSTTARSRASRPSDVPAALLAGCGSDVVVRPQTAT